MRYGMGTWVLLASVFGFLSSAWAGPSAEQRWGGQVQSDNERIRRYQEQIIEQQARIAATQLKLQELQQYAQALDEVMKARVPFMLFFESFQAMADECVRGPEARVPRLQQQVEQAITQAREKLTLSGFHSESEINSNFVQLRSEFDRAKIWISDFMGAIDQCGGHFYYLKSQMTKLPSMATLSLERLAPFQVPEQMQKFLEQWSEQNLTFQIGKVRSFVDQALEHLTALREIAQRHYEFFTSDVIFQRRGQAVARMMQDAYSRSFDELLNGLGSFETLLSLVNEVLALKDKLEYLNYELDYARIRHHNIFLADKLPEFKSEVEKARSLLSSFPPELRSHFIAQVLDGLIESIPPYFPLYERKLNLITLEESLLLVKRDVPDRVRGVELRLQEKPDLPPTLTTSLEQIRHELSETTDLEAQLRLYYQLDITARDLDREYL